MKNLVIAILLAFVMGCAAIQETREKLPTAQTYNVPKSVIWPVVVDQISAQYPVKMIEKDGGLITTEVVQIPVGENNAGSERYIYPPGGFLPTWSGLRVNLSTKVAEIAPGKTEVSINTHYEAYESHISNRWVYCISNGSLEHDLLNQVSLQLAKTKQASASQLSK